MQKDHLQADCVQAKCDTAGPIGSDTSVRSERVALVDAIVAEGDQLARYEPIGPGHNASTLRCLQRPDLLLIADRFGIDGRLYTDSGLAVEILAEQSQRMRFAQESRIEKVNQAQERIAKMADRLRAILPEGMRLGDYLNHHKHETTTKQRPRPASRIH